MFFLFSLAFSYFEISRCIVPRKVESTQGDLLVWELKRLPWGYGECLSHLSIPSNSTVPSIRRSSKSVCELSSNFSCPSQKKLLLPTRGRKQVHPRNNIYSKDLCAEFLRRFPSSLPRYSSPLWHLKEQALHVIPSFIRLRENLVDNGQECGPTTRLYLFHPIRKAIGT